MQPLRGKGNRTSRKGAGHKGEVAFGGNRSVDVSECSKQGRRSFTFLPPPRSWRRRRWSIESHTSLIDNAATRPL